MRRVVQPIHPLVLLAFLLLAQLAGCAEDSDPPATTKDITAFEIPEGTASFLGTEITVKVPLGTNVSALVATFTTNGARVTVDETEQVSGSTANDFTQPVTYTVEAEDGSTKTYGVKVTGAASSSKDLTAFAFLDSTNAALTADVTATIVGSAIAVSVPTGTNVTALVATFATTGSGVKVASMAQTSGATANNFTMPVTYVVAAADGSTKSYTVTVAVAASTAKDLTAFAFLDATNAALTADVTGTVTATDIALTVPAGTNVSSLVATFSTTGASVKVGTTAQVSGVTANNFSTPVTYVVTAANGTMKSYTVTVTVAASSAKALTAFGFLDATNPALTADVTGTITGTAIAVTVPAGTDVSALVATFTTTGDSVAVGATAQASGVTANNFTSPVTYVVTAADGTMQSYVVTVTIAS